MSANYRNPNWLLPNELNQSINTSLSESRKSLYSMNFDGSDYINFGTISALNGGVTAFSTSIWFNYTGSPSSSTHMLLSGGTGVTDRVYIQLISTNTIRYAMGGGYDDVNVGTLTSGVWYNLTTVQDGTNINIYLNGVPKGSFTDDAPTSNFATNLRLGNYISGSYWWNGKIDEVGIWNKALNQSEIDALSTANAPANLMALSAKPIAYWPLGEFAGNSGELEGTPSGQTNSWKFPNQAIKDYVFDFDGNDFIDLGNSSSLQITSNLSISAWFKIDNSSSNSYFNIVTKWISSDAAWSSYVTKSTGILSFWISTNGSTQLQIHSTTNVNDGKWHHFLGINDGTNTKLYIDGNLEDTGTGGTIYNSTQNVLIGKTNQNSFLFSGEISNVAIWNSDQTSEKDNIYNNGSPATSYTNTPTAWWKLNAATSSYNPATSTWTITDSAGSNNGTSTTLPSTSLIPSDLQFESPYSNFSLDFDGAGNSVNCTNDSVLDITGSITLSCWMKSSNTGANRKLLTKDDGSTRSFQINTNHASIGPYTYFWLGGGTIKSVSTGTPNQIVDGNWHHVVSVFKSGEYIRMYIDGVQAGNTGVTETTLDSSTANFLIGSNGWSGTVGIDGNVDEVAVWSSALTDAQVNQVYNNGRPGDLSSLSPVSWWRLGEDAFFVNNNITIPNQISGGPTGTGSGTQTAMLSADAPQSYGGGYGVGLAVTDKIGDAPESTANSLSYNMIPDNRHPYTPSYVPAKVDNAFSMSFDAASDNYMLVPGSAFSASASDFSISFWYFRSSNPSGHETVIYKANNFEIYQHSNGQAFWTYFGVVSSNTNKIPIVLNDWKHVCYVVTSTGFKGYQNGSLVAENTFSSTPNYGGASNSMYFGGQQSVKHSNMKLDEIAFFDYALTPKQIKEDIYNASTTGKTADLSNNSNLTAPVAWYRMGD